MYNTFPNFTGNGVNGFGLWTNNPFTNPWTGQNNFAAQYQNPINNPIWNGGFGTVPTWINPLFNYVPNYGGTFGNGYGFCGGFGCNTGCGFQLPFGVNGYGAPPSNWNGNVQNEIGYWTNPTFGNFNTTNNPNVGRQITPAEFAGYVAQGCRGF